jgi:lipid-binding SYLF domain-containing protein
MTLRTRIAVLGLIVVASGNATVSADDERLKAATAVLSEMTQAVDRGIPQSLLVKARCVVVVPAVKKAAIGFGGQYGRGYMSCRRAAGGWSAPAGVRLEGGSVGLQIGGAETDVVMLVLNDRGLDRLLSSRFTVGAEAAVAAGPVGRNASAQTDATMMAEMLAWSRARGVFAGVSLQGATLRDDAGENRELYGREMTNREVVTGDTAPPPAAAGLMAALDKAAGTAAASR